MQFEWDENKNQKNIKSHGIDFNYAIKVFEDPNRVTIWDEAHSTLEEEREITIGKINDMLIVFVVSTDVADVTRIISARKAEHIEEVFYYEQNNQGNVGRC